jgi:hypothetical protein
MKYIIKPLLLVIIFIFALSFFLVVNVLYITSYLIWYLKMPSWNQIRSKNEYYTRERSGEATYYATYINYLFDYKGYRKPYD